MPKKKQSTIAEASAVMNAGFGKIARRFMTLYVLLMLCGFPFLTHDAYFDILETRFQGFWTLTLGMGVIILLLSLAYLLCDLLYTEGRNTKAFFARLNPRHYHDRLKPRLLPTDIPFAVLILIYLLSMALSGYPYETWWGNRGRYMGVLMWLMLFLAYVCITRFYRLRRWHVYAFLLAGLGVCLWGLTDFFQLNVFGFFDEVPDRAYWSIFAASIGNINSYTSYLALLLAVSMGLFVRAEKLPEGLFALAAFCIANQALICGMSDNVVFTYGMLYAAAPLLLWQQRRHVLRYGICLLITLLAMRLGGIMINTPALGTINMGENNGILITLGSCSALWLPILALGAVLLIGGLLTRRTMGQALTKLPKRLWTGLIVLGIAAVLGVLIDANMGNHAALWQPFSSFLCFNDKWGTGRGFAWRMALTYFVNDMPFLQKLFGYGPDTYYMITMDNYFQDMVNAGYGMFDSAHNEYLNYLMTIGIAGLLAYLWLCLRFLKTWRRRAQARPMYYVPMLMLLAYSAQAFINICVPIVYPILAVAMFAFMAGEREEIV